MKISTLIAIAFLSLLVLAAGGCASQIAPASKTPRENGMMAEEGFEMLQGRMMMVNEKAKTSSPMEKEAILNDGTEVMADGTIVRPDGARFALKEGESVWMDGSFLKAGEMMEDSAAGKDAMMPGNYQGTHLAGTASPYLAFTRADYEKALSENKVILLYFYANWCPVCRVEQKETTAFFDGLDREDVIGFRVNFKDSDTDADEGAMAKQFGVPYQHTKAIIKDGKQVLKSLEQWDRKKYEDALSSI